MNKHLTNKTFESNLQLIVFYSWSAEKYLSLTSQGKSSSSKAQASDLVLEFLLYILCYHGRRQYFLVRHAHSWRFLLPTDDLVTKGDLIIIYSTHQQNLQERYDYAWSKRKKESCLQLYIISLYPRHRRD
jgi:hypothetical protein